VKISGRERRLLGLLAALAAGWGLWTLWQLARPGVPAAPVEVARTGTGRAARSRGAGVPDHVVVIDTARLDPVARDLKVGRDPFRFAPVAPPPPSADELARQRAEEERRRQLAEQQAAAVPSGPRPPSVTVRYLGNFGPPSHPIAVFVDATESNVYNAREGDTVEGKFIVQKIGYESVDLAFVGFPDAPAQRLGLSP
jgi:hypothetical protein